MGKYAVLLNGDTDDVGSTVNGLEYALDLDGSGHEVDVFLDGAATQWPGQLTEKPDHPVNNYFSDARDRDLVAGACGFCAHAFGGAEGCREAGVELLGDENEHNPDVGELATEGYELITVG